MTPTIENHTKTLVGRVEATTIKNGKFVRKIVYLGLYESDDTEYDVAGHALGKKHTIRRTLNDTSTGYGTCTFASFEDLKDRFLLWTAGSYWNDSTLLHPETLALVELNQFERVVERVVERAAA